MTTPSSYKIKIQAKQTKHANRFDKDIVQQYETTKPHLFLEEDSEDDIALIEAMRKAIRSIQPPADLKEAILKGEKYKAD